MATQEHVGGKTVQLQRESRKIMAKVLSGAQLDKFRAEGYVAPIRAISIEQAQRIRERLEDYEQSHGGPLKGALRTKSHLLFTWLNELVREERIVDAIEDLYGENLLCWSTNFFIKEAHDPAFVSWHQDSTYWGLSRPDVVTAWVALTESTQANGALQVVPGTHLMDQIPHKDTYSEGNLLTRGQEVAVDVDPGKVVTIALQPGEMSLHHVRIIHGSAPNQSNDRRIGFAIRYIPTSVRQLEGDDSATLVRGVDTFKTFEHERIPARDLDPEFIEMHRVLVDRSMGILYKGAEVKG
jgi:ectoine hydroxylase-related dioxygenase (phytanoyl-CoA dioxygenase family)